MEDIYERIQDLYTALGDVDDSNLVKYSGVTLVGEKSALHVNNFRGGTTDSQLRNYLQQLVSQIAHLEYHLCRWATRNGRSKDRVEWWFKNNHELCIIHDLSNNTKHGYPRRSGRNRSKDSPRLVGVERYMQLRPNARKNSYSQIQIPFGRSPIKSGDGRASIVTNGRVVREDGSLIGDLHEMMLKAVESLEQLMEEIGCIILTR